MVDKQIPVVANVPGYLLLPLVARTKGLHMNTINILKVTTMVSLFSVTAIHSGWPIQIQRKLEISVKNNTSEPFEYINVEFLFKGPNDRNKKQLKGMVTVNDLKAGATAYFNSKEAMYRDSKAMDLFKKRPESVQLLKIEAGNSKIKGTTIGIGGVQKEFKNGTDFSDFGIVTKQNTLGVSYYEIEEMYRPVLKSIFGR